MSIKYYKGTSIAGATELSAADISTVSTYSKAYVDDDGVLMRTELHDHGQLSEVNYYAAGRSDELVASHLREYPGIRFVLWRTLSVHPGYVWKFASSYDATGVVTNFTKILSDEAESELMEIEIDEEHEVRRITKYWWEADGTLRYAFEFDGLGKLYSATDLLYGDHAVLAEVLADLPNREFYEKGHSLPRALAGTVIPPDPE